MELVFFGTGPVAAASLEMLAQHFDIEAVITKQAPVGHKGKAPVVEIAQQFDIPIIFANTRQDLDHVIDTKRLTSQLGIIVDFGVIVSKKVINYFSKGIINSHFSLLPRWRGADPISFAILAGDQKTGVSLMLIEPTLDTGKILVQKSIKIDPKDTTPSLTDKLVTLSNQLLETYIPRYFRGEMRARSQPHPDRATYSRKLTKDDGLIDWSKPAEHIAREIRAFVGWPRSRTVLANKEIIITQANVLPDSQSNEKPGIVSQSHGMIMVTCGQGTLCIERLQPAGKREMSAQEFLTGNKL